MIKKLLLPTKFSLIFSLSLIMVLQAFTWISTSYGKFIGISYYSVEKTFINKKGQEVILLGMSHAAHDEFYQNIQKKYKNFNGKVLLEGVRDVGDSDINHNHFAKIFQLSVQSNDMLFSKNNSVNADVSISKISKNTLSDLDMVFYFLEEVSNKNWENAQKALIFLGNNDSMEITLHEIIHKRNDYLMLEINKKLETENNLLIPWGLAHLPEIEEKLKNNEFKEKEFRLYKIFNIPKMMFSFLLFLIK